jgi:hypothetical protein
LAITTIDCGSMVGTDYGYPVGIEVKPVGDAAPPDAPDAADGAATPPTDGGEDGH